MKIAGLVKSSFVDYPGKIAAVVFTPGCNLNCFYCHNRHILRACGTASDTISPKALDWLKTRRGLLDAVVVTGGEPTIQSDLAKFIAQVRTLGFLVKLDTNGTCPAVLASLIKTGQIDYVAMDIKGSPEKYQSICRAPVDLDAIGTSIDLLLASKLDYEFRTTIVSQLTHSDILTIGRRIQGARRYVLQRYRPPHWPVSHIGEQFGAPPHRPVSVLLVMEDLKHLVMDCRARGFLTCLPQPCLR